MTHVIITGGSSGIGLEIARLYIERGFRVSLIARRASILAEAEASLDGLAKKHGASIFTGVADVADEAALKAAVEQCEAAFGPCDLLVTSAGQVEPAPFEQMQASQFNAQIFTNVIGTANAVRAVYQGMITRGRGKIMVISSAAAWIGIHGYSAYCASKSALIGFVEALRSEAKSKGIAVSICFPPDTITPQYQAELPKRSAAANALMGSQAPWPVTEVASRIVSAIERGKTTLHFGLSLTLLSYLGPLVKPILYWSAERSLQTQGRSNARVL